MSKLIEKLLVDASARTQTGVDRAAFAGESFEPWNS